MRPPTLLWAKYNGPPKAKAKPLTAPGARTLGRGHHSGGFVVGSVRVLSVHVAGQDVTRHVMEDMQARRHVKAGIIPASLVFNLHSVGALIDRLPPVIQDDLFMRFRSASCYDVTIRYVDAEIKIGHDMSALLKNSHKLRLSIGAGEHHSLLFTNGPLNTSIATCSWQGRDALKKMRKDICGMHMAKLNRQALDTLIGGPLDGAQHKNKLSLTFPVPKVSHPAKHTIVLRDDAQYQLYAIFPVEHQSRKRQAEMFTSEFAKTFPLVAQSSSEQISIAEVACAVLSSTSPSHEHTAQQPAGPASEALAVPQDSQRKSDVEPDHLLGLHGDMATFSGSNSAPLGRHRPASAVEWVRKTVTADNGEIPPARVRPTSAETNRVHHVLASMKLPDPPLTSRLPVDKRRPQSAPSPGCRNPAFNRHRLGICGRDYAYEPNFGYERDRLAKTNGRTPQEQSVERYMSDWAV
eukprot:gnl/MRDRNA2_/MRDRNA2_203519_c0_seq1.p1 gnl/MRDRNA2_/MRDRNA2_203519_c0~~gnl/MRDRNA2_/MRDRNA2_203519_c0_seq1.p1  ORF type:complete len:478 (-),score=73.73 gnl/MRDRNA2_/MRDRNA2_203519_c0_seq1:43-1434(-)